MADQRSDVSDTVDKALSALRDQRDDKQAIDCQGSNDFNPQLFSAGGGYNHLIIGPILFDTPFSTTPVVVLEQAAQNTNRTGEVGVAQTYVPFLVHPYVYQWSFLAGKVAGFFMGLYALTTPISGTTRHTIMWKASGKGTQYQPGAVDSSWSDSYNNNSTNFLTLDDTDPTDSTGDLSDSAGSDNPADTFANVDDGTIDYWNSA